MKKFSARPFQPPFTALLMAALALSVAVPARADLRPAVSVRPTADQALAKTGIAQRYSVVITAAEDLDLEGIDLTGPGWVVTSIDAPAVLSLRAGESTTLSFVATTSQPDEQLVLTAYVGDHEVSMGIDLSPTSRRWLEGAQPGKQLDVEMPIPTIDPSAITPVPMPPAPDHPQATGPEETEDEGFLARAARSVRVRGMIGYLRNDGTLLPADNCIVELWEDDVDPNPDDFIATFSTNSLGNFDYTFFWDAVSEAEPDLYIVYKLDSGRTKMQTTSGDLYVWGSTTWQNYAGSDLQMGTWSAGDAAQYPAFHLFTNLQRTWRYISDRGWDAPKVTGVWPDAGAPTGYYTNNEIHMSAAVQWEEDTTAHEWGHHWAASFATASFDTYCNGTCDANPALGQCGWCFWCGETERVAWNEGIANLFGDLCPKQWGALYGQPAASTNKYAFETLQTCNGTLANPWLDTGHMGALLRDIVDTTNDDHPQYPGTDQLGLGWTQVLTTVDLDVPQRPQEFLSRFTERYPQYFAQLNSTAQNCGFADTQGPTNLANLTSPSHGNGAWSTDTTVDFTWTEPTDVWSGTSQYAVLVNKGNEAFPGFTPNLGDVTSYTSGPLLTGEWWFSIYPIDRAGNGSAVYWYWGVARVIGSDGPNLQPIAGTWPYPMVPRATDDASFTAAGAPTSLTGNAVATYLNAKRQNTGGVTTVGSGHVTRHYVDGVQFGANFPAGVGIPAGTFMFEPNQGPYNVRGGRHTVHMQADVDNTEPERVETDNEYGRQWIWSPLTVAPSVSLSRSAPPLRTAGHNTVPVGSQTLYSNVDGLRIEDNSPGYWDALVLWPQGGADYDLYAHTTISTGATSGFGAPDLASTRGAGALDIVLANRNNVGGALDVGVFNYNSASTDYVVQNVWASNNFMILEESRSAQLDAQNPAQMIELFTVPGQAGLGTAYVRTEPPTAGVSVRWFAQSTQFDHMSGYERIATTDASGTASLPLDLTVDDTFSMALITRDPSQGLTPVTVTLKLREPMQAAVVGGPAGDVSVYSVPDGSGLALTEALQWDGVAGSTPAVVDATVSVRIVNSRTGAPVVQFPRADIRLVGTGIASCAGLQADANTDADGVARFTLPLPAGGTTTSGPLRVVLVDAPAQTTTGETRVLVNSPDLDGDGDVDLADVGVFAGDFSGAYSYRSDFRWDGLVNLADVGEFASAVGVTCGASAVIASTQDETGVAELRDVLLLHFDEDGRENHASLQAGEVLTAYLSLEGPAAQEGIRGWEASLHTSPNMRIVSTHLGPRMLDFGERSDHVVGTGDVLRAENSAPLRLMTLRLQVTDDQPAHVWIRGSSLQSLGKDVPAIAVGDDQLELRPVAGSRNGSDLPALTLNDGGAAQNDTPLRGEIALRVAPNPFNPATEIFFELPRKSVAVVRIYDVAGRRVRELGGRMLDVGAHVITWNGTDDDGRVVVSGVYYCRLYLDGEPVDETRSMTLVK